jgi:hypothetical protein
LRLLAAVGSPHLAQQLAVREHAARVFDQNAQQLVFDRRKVHDLPRQRDAAATQIDLELSDRKA